ncbi:hypothetical protein PESP_a3234 [Pseudoalteromonas espejiana DSM 9414]|uniref:Uncharacterized protein n=1 Tax=Pseudoalteromonas espejiana TaxID=28107 RepID=A0A510Y1B0_9GAMM|nr:hypothetical protein [Pseudoalteromonas espejiana]ASM51080.1 hypothetical protein PESP_a3234 [Pseudoalteromonas espejiana DSM 9414]GEK57069.1 hypothetical protein PES01_39140 [Pseudoalteromonas espejiana]
MAEAYVEHFCKAFSYHPIRQQVKRLQVIALYLYLSLAVVITLAMRWVSLRSNQPTVVARLQACV